MLQSLQVHGGLKMPDTDVAIKANKLNFIKQILNLESIYMYNKTASCILRTKVRENFLKHKPNITFLHPNPKFNVQLLDT